MAVTRASKETELQELEGEYRGLKVPEVTELRRQVRGARGQYKVVKNTLATRAIKGTAFESLTEHFVGTTAVAYSGDDALLIANTAEDGWTIIATFEDFSASQLDAMIENETILGPVPIFANGNGAASGYELF